MKGQDRDQRRHRGWQGARAVPRRDRRRCGTLAGRAAAQSRSVGARRPRSAPPAHGTRRHQDPATRKSTFARERFGDTHLQLNLDMLRTRHREDVLFGPASRRSSRRDRQHEHDAGRRAAIWAPKAASSASSAVTSLQGGRRWPGRLTHRGCPHPRRGAPRDGGRLEAPRLDEGFDELRYVRMEPTGFVVEGWRDEV
jgi:hypothetical protein